MPPEKTDSSARHVQNDLLSEFSAPSPPSQTFFYSHTIFWRDT
jgi:hypothetical protein